MLSTTLHKHLLVEGKDTASVTGKYLSGVVGGGGPPVGRRVWLKALGTRLQCCPRDRISQQCQLAVCLEGFGSQSLAAVALGSDLAGSFLWHGECSRRRSSHGCMAIGGATIFPLQRRIIP